MLNYVMYLTNKDVFNMFWMFPCKISALKTVNKWLNPEFWIVGFGWAKIGLRLAILFYFRRAELRNWQTSSLQIYITFIGQYKVLQVFKEIEFVMMIIMFWCRTRMNKSISDYSEIFLQITVKFTFQINRAKLELEECIAI